jgi:hypothetical protein
VILELALRIEPGRTNGRTCAKQVPDEANPLERGLKLLLGRLAALQEIWNEFVHWKRHIEKTLPEEEKLFHTKMNGLTVWVIEDAVAYTLIYPEDY